MGKKNKVVKMIDHITEITKSLIKLLLEIGTLVAVVKMILESL